MWWKKRPQKVDHWRCRHCGETHEDLPTDFGWQLPDEVWALGQEAREAHLAWSTDVCHHEGRWFLRGVLGLPFTFDAGRWGWGCWAEVREETVKTRWSLQDGDGSHLPPEAGILACEIPGYPDAKGLPLQVHWGRAELRPTFHLATDLWHPLALDQRNGIDEVQYHAILTLVMG
jgi:hypothetical protein